MNKKYITTIAILLTILSLGCVSPMAGVEGRYVSEVNPDAYLELRSDGQFVVNQDMSFSGEYTVNGDTVKLIYTFGSFVLVVDGNMLIDEDGERWIKI